nr:MAG: hypothetical protein DIU80_23935 [Chloroflexota bacterium]
MNFRNLLTWSGTAAAIALLLLPLPIEGAAQRWPALTEAVQNFAHPVLFAWLAHHAFVALRRRQPQPSRAPFVQVLLIALVCGAATEMVQSFTGRTVSLTDLINDVLGAGFVLLIHALAEQPTPAGRRRLAVLAVVSGTVLAAPLSITSAAYVMRSVQAPVLWKDGTFLSWRFSSWQTGWYTGLVVDEPVADWTAWRFLEVDLENPAADPLPIVVRVHDRLHNQWLRDRYNGRFIVSPETRETLRIPVEDIRHGPENRFMDMEAIRGIAVFTITRGATRHFKVQEIRLVP